MGVNENQEKESANITKKKGVLPIILAFAAVIVFLLLALFTAAFAFIFLHGASDGKVKKQLSLGEKYVSELDYDNAILTYEKALEIDTKCEEAYLGLGNIYIDLAEQSIENGEYEEAEEYLEKGEDILKQGYKETNSEEINNLIDSIEDLIKKIEEDNVESEETEQTEETVNENDDNSSVMDEEEKTDAEEIVYQAILKDYYDAIINHADWHSFDYSLGDEYFFAYGETGYLIWDLNGDGISELLIGFTSPNEMTEGVILALYSYKDGKVNQVFTSYERYLYQYLSDGTLKNIWNASADNSGIDYYILDKDTQLSLVTDSDAIIKNLQFVSFSNLSFDSQNGIQNVEEANSDDSERILSIDEMCEKVKNCYYAIYGEEAPEVSVFDSNEESVIIEVHEGTTTLEWFFIERKSGKASTYFYGDVDLNQY